MSTTVGDRVRRLRQERGLSQEDVARHTSIGLRSYGEIERGHVRDPHLSTLRGIARALGVPVEVLLREPAPLGEATLPPELDPTDLEDWAAGVDSIPELKRVAKSLWPLYARLAGTIGRPVPAGDAERLAEVGRKLDIITERMMELAPTPLATITERLDGPTEIHFLREPTLEERAGLRAEHPGAVVVEAKRVSLVYS
jgi:transcriptional regulator with XRE-family HTH domain